MARSPTPRESRAAASAPTVARKASQRGRASGAAEAGNAGGTSVKFRLMPSRPVPCGLAVPTPHPMTMSTLLLFADALVAPALLADLRELDELMVALSCRFALDIFTIAQQDRPDPEPDHLPHDPGCDLWF